MASFFRLLLHLLLHLRLRLVRVMGLEVILLLIAALASVANARAQWLRSPSPLLGKNGSSNGGAAMFYCDGVVWAAHGWLMRSDDDGLSWRTVPTPFLSPGEFITSIHFVNKDTGVISSHTHIGYTTD